MKTAIERLKEIARYLNEMEFVLTSEDITAIIHDLEHPWIKTSDRLPEDATKVTILHEEMGSISATWFNGFWFTRPGSYRLQPESVTHWMPLPKDPE